LIKKGNLYYLDSSIFSYSSLNTYNGVTPDDDQQDNPVLVVALENETWPDDTGSYNEHADVVSVLCEKTILIVYSHCLYELNKE
jgi:hypothetical protein